ncbi:MAG: hypothetical protein R6V04_10115 [bacterium]
MASVSFPGPIPVPAGQPYPEMQPRGNIWQDAGAGLRQTGADIDKFQQQMSAAEMQKARIDEMVERRRLAIEAQRAKEEFERRDMEFKAAQAEEEKKRFEAMEKRRVAGEDRLRTETERRAKEDERKIEARKELGKWLMEHEQKFGKEPDDEIVRKGANFFGIGNEWEKFARRKPSGSYGNFYRKRGEKIEDAENLIPRLERQLDSLVHQFNYASGLNYTRSQFLTNPEEIQKVIETLPVEQEKRRAIQQAWMGVFKGVQRLDEAYVKAKKPFTKQTSAADVADTLKAARKRLAAKKAEYESIKGYSYTPGR